MQINEIFSSIEGEGIRSGYLATFVRTQGCNLRCIYCDTKYSWDEDKGFVNMSIDEIVDKCRELGNRRITLTGGEPLLQPDIIELVERLTRENYEVNIETNGAVDLKPLIKNDNIDRRQLIITMDWKSPSSLMRDQMIWSNLLLLQQQDVLKFVVGSHEDLMDMVQTLLATENISYSVFVSPIFGQIEGQEIVAFMKQYHLEKVRLQLQLHKYVWPPEMRGV